MDKDTLTAKLVLLNDSKKITVAKIAKHVGVASTNVSLWLTGAHVIPDKHVEKLSKLLYLNRGKMVWLNRDYHNKRAHYR